MASFHTKFALLIFNTWPSVPCCQATITSHLIFLNVQVQCQTSPPPHLFVWKYGESTKFLIHFLLANQISGVLYLSFHSKDVLFFYATLLLLPLHFSLLWQCYVVVGQNVWGQLVHQHLEQPAREGVWTNHSHRFKAYNVPFRPQNNQHVSACQPAKNDSKQHLKFATIILGARLKKTFWGGYGEESTRKL